METKNVLLDFSQTDFSDAKVCDENSLIHQSKLEDFKVIADRHIASAKSEFSLRESGVMEAKYEHNTISIFANRGAGKTTFLLSALDRMGKWYPDEILCLKLIDPSKVEKGENTFIDIIARIQEQVNIVMERKQKTLCLDENCRDQKKSVERSYKKLMDGIAFLDGIGKTEKYDDWDDAEFAAMQGMEKAISSINIDEVFQDYVFKALRFINKRCFVVSFDDIDTDFNKGYQILEVIRKYLTTPLIMTILTGDLELYGKLVRKASWDCFSSNFLKKECEFANRNKIEFSTMIDQLENQYLVKILKPENRIQLSSIKEYLSESGFHLFVKFDKSDEQRFSLESCYTQLLKEIGAYKERSKLDDELREFMLGLSLRIQIRLLTQIRDLGLMKGGNHDKHKENKLATGILSVFWNDINQKANNAKALTMSSPVYTIEMLKFLKFTNSMEVGATFLPETTDEILNKALFAVGTKYNEQVKIHNHLVFDYWIRISLIALLTDRIWQKDRDSLGELLGYAQLLTDAGLAKSLCLMKAFYYSIGPNMPQLPGQLFLEEEPFVRSNFRNILSMLPAFGIEDAQKNKVAYLSVFKIIAVISDLLRVEANEEEEETELKGIIAQILKMGQYRNYTVPKMGPWFQGGRLPGQKEMVQEMSDPFMFDEDEKMNEVDTMVYVKKIRKWKNREVNVSCQSLNRIFVRFYHTLISLDNQNSIYPLAERFSRMILALLNSTLVEACMDNGMTDVEMNVISDIEQTFIYNYTRYSELKPSEKQNFSFFNWMKECPLLTVFIDPFIASYIDGGIVVSTIMKDREKQYIRLHHRVKERDYREKNRQKLAGEEEKLNNAIEDVRRLIRYRHLFTQRDRLERMQMSASGISETQNIFKHLNTLTSEIEEAQKKLTSVSLYEIHVSAESGLEELNNALHSLLVYSFENNIAVKKIERQISMIDDAIGSFGLRNDYQNVLQKVNNKSEKTSAFLYLMKTYPIVKE